MYVCVCITSQSQMLQTETIHFKDINSHIVHVSMYLANHRKTRDKCPFKHRIQQEKRLDKKFLSHQCRIQDYVPSTLIFHVR